MKPKLEGGGGEGRRELLKLVGSLRMEVSRIVTLFSSVLYLFYLILSLATIDKDSSQ